MVHLKLPIINNKVKVNKKAVQCTCVLRKTLLNNGSVDTVSNYLLHFLLGNLENAPNFRSSLCVFALILNLSKIFLPDFS